MVWFTFLYYLWLWLRLDTSVLYFLTVCIFLWLAVQVKHQQAWGNPSAAAFSAVRNNNCMIVTVSIETKVYFFLLIFIIIYTVTFHLPCLDCCILYVHVKENTDRKRQRWWSSQVKARCWLIFCCADWVSLQQANVTAHQPSCRCSWHCAVLPSVKKTTATL